MIYVYRNSTVEHLFKIKDKIDFSDYGAIDFHEGYETYVWFYIYPIKNNVKQILKEISDYYEKIELIVNKIPKTSKFILITLYNFEPNFNYINNGKIDIEVMQYNLKLHKLCELYDNVAIFDIKEFLYDKNINEILDYRHYYLYQIVISPKFSKQFSLWFRHKLEVLNGNRRKCIVLDLDNTLWGGVLGEDLIEGIKLNEEYPGSCYLDFQELLYEANRHGVILAICSKNNLADVEEVWRKHPYIKLKKNHFSCVKINWNDKASNIKEISNDLNIGLDSFVFIDDNPLERELVKSVLPEVNVPDFPKEPYQLRSFFIDLYKDFFEIFNLTEEDKNKLQQYKENIQRKQVRAKYKNINEYIKDLNIKIEIQEANKFNLSRIAQMTQKTNQFNLTTKRYTEQKLISKLNSGSFVACAKVSDKFGNNGITIGVVIDIDKNDRSAIIDSYFLSCRILGRGIEFAFMKFIINYIVEKFNIDVVYGKYIPTKKNMQTSFFYDKLDFKTINVTGKDEKIYIKKIIGKYIIQKIYQIGVV